jgi:TP901 family phage tail tape measure protein
MADTQSNIQVNIDTTQALASIKNLQRQISAFHSSMAKGGAAANAVSTQLQQTLINSINATGQFSAGIRTIRTTTESFTDSLEKNKFSLGEYFRYAGGATKTFGRLFKTEHDTINKVARENVKDLQTQYIRLGRDASGAMKSIAVRPLALDMTDLGTRTQIAAQKQAILNQLLKQGSTNLLNFGKNTQWAGRQLMVGFTLPLIALGSAASKTFMDMETQAIRFKKVYGDLFTSTAESQQALKDIQELGKEFTKYGIAVSTTVELAAEAAAAGFKGVDLQRQTAAATRLSILGQVESQKALETTIALQNAFSMSSENLAESIDFLNAVENQTVLSLDDVATAIPKAAPVVQQLGGDVKDLAFLMTAMKEGGINASEGANALKSGLASLINPTGKANDMLLSFGINAKKIVLDNKGDLKKTVVEFATALNMLDPLNRAQAIEQMFGKFQFARLSTLFANVTKEGTQASRVLDLAGASVQELAGLAEKELGMTSESAMNKFKGAVENLKLSLIPLGEQFLKAVTPIAEFITKVLNKFEGLSENTKKIIVTITALVAGLGPVLLMTVGLVMNGLANMIKLFTFLKSSFNRTGQATAVLGTEVQYMTTEQRNAAAVAASLDQVHTKLQQTFTSEAAAVNALTRAYQRAIAAQSQFVPVAPPITRGPIKKFADGRPLTVGGTGNKDSELALLMPGETVIPTKMSKKYGPLINAMIAGNIPGYEFGKTFSFGGKDFDIPQGSLPAVQRVIAEAQSLSGVISDIDDVILAALERLTSGIEGSTKITAKRLASALAPVTDLARSTLAKQGTFTGNAGVVMAHGLPKVTLTPEQITAFEELPTGTTFGSRLKDRSGGPVTGLTNMVFPMPAGFNQDRMTGAEGAQWIGQNRSRFTGDIAAQAGLDPNDPDLLRFGTAVGRALKSAAYKGVVVTQQDFEKIISDALETEIFAVGKNTSAAVKAAFSDAKKVSTLMYPETSGTGRTSYPRVPVPAAVRGTTVEGVDLSTASSYKNRSATTAMNVEADRFTMKAVRARVRRFFTRMPKEVEQEVKEVLDITSPSKVTKQLGSDTASGFVAGVKELNDDAKSAGQQIGSSLVDGTTQSARRRRVATRAQGPVVTQSGRVPRRATRPQGPAPIGATPLPGMTILPIVPPDPNGPNPTGPTTTSQTRGQMLADKARGVGGRLNTFGGGMGLLGVNMGLSMVPDFAGKGILQGGLAGANLGQMFGPYGMAIGATIGTVSSAVAALIGKYKELQAVTAATFKSSTDLATFFGNKVVDTTVKVGSLSSSILGVANASNTLAKSFGYTNEELSRFVSLIESLPEDNPLRTIVEGLKDEDNPDKINEIAKAFIATQVALGQIKPDQAQKSLDLILAASGKVAMVGSSFINFQSQTQAIAISLRNATGNADGLGTSLIQLVGAASNSTSLIDMMAIIDGIALSGLSAAGAITAMRNAFLSVGNTQAAQSVTALERIPGIQKEQLAYLLATGTRGFREKITKDTKISDIMKRAEEFNDKYFKQLSGTNVTQTLAYKEAEAEAEGTKKQIDLLKQKKKIIDDQIKKQEKITNEIKRQNDYLDKQRSLDKEIVEAKIRGDYIGAAGLLQEKTQNTVEFNREEEKAALQAKSDALQEQIDALQLRNDEIVAAINKSAETAAAASDAAATKIINGLTPGGFDYDQPQDEGNKKTDKVVPTEILDRVGGKTVAQTTTDPQTGERKLLESGIFQTRLMRFKNAGRGLKPGDIVQVGPDGDIIAVQTDNPVKPKTSGSIQITHVDKDQGIAQFRVHYASGGMIRGAGTATSDSIPAYLSNGEYVVKAKSVKKYGTETLDALNAGKFATGGQVGRSSSSYIPRLAEGGVAQRFKNGIPAFGSGGPAWLTSLKTMGKFGVSGALYKLMEDGERWLSLKHGANENSSGFHKWSKAIARALYNVPQGAASGAPFAVPGLIGGAIFGGLEGLEGLRRDGSQYGVKGGSKSTEKGFSAKKELDSMSFQQTSADALKAFGISSILGPLINLLPKGVQKAITTRLGQNVVSSALIGMAPFNPAMGFGTPVKPLTSLNQKFGASKPGSAVEQRISGMSSSTFSGSINSIENQTQSFRAANEVSSMLVNDMFASAMRVAEASGRYAPSFLGKALTQREGPDQFAMLEEIDPLVDDVTTWPWESTKPSPSPMVSVPTIINKLSLKQRRMIAFLAGKKSSLVGVPKVTKKELDSGYNWYYKQYGDDALDWDTFKTQHLASVGLKNPSHTKLLGYTQDTRAFEALHENDRMYAPPGQSWSVKKFRIGERRQSDEFDKIYGPNNIVRYETPLMDQSDYGEALRIKFKKVYDELVRTGYIRKAWYDAKGKRHEQKATAPLPEGAAMGSWSVRGKALTPYEFFKAVAGTLPDGNTSSRQAGANLNGKPNYLDRPDPFTQAVNQVYAQQHGILPGEKIRFWKYDLYGSPLKNDKGEPVAAGYYTLDKGMAYAYARGRGNTPSQADLDSGSQNVFMGPGPEMAQSRGAYYVDLYPHEVPQVLGLGGLKDEMAIVIGETLAKKKSVFTGMAKSSEYQYEVDPGAIRGLSPWKMYAPGNPWTVESDSAVFGVPIADSARMAYLLNTEQLSLRLGGKKEWSDQSVSQVLKNAAPYITKDGTSRFIAQDAIPRYWTSGAEEVLERMLKAQEMYNLIRVHIQNLPRVEFLKTLSKEIPKVPGMYKGGLIKGPGTGTSDSIRATLGYAGGGSIRVSNGEYVVKASSVRDYGVKTMDAINNGTARVGTESNGTVYNINMPVTSNNANPEIVANEVMRKLKLEISKNNKTNKVGG